MHHHLSSKRKIEGFTLVEVLIAMMILLVGLLGIASMQIMAMKGNQHARESTEKTVTANSIMEWLVGLPFDSDNLRVTHADLDPTVAVVRHSIIVEADGTLTMEAEFGDGSTDDIDTAPPANLIPQGGAKNIQEVKWTVDVHSWEDDGDGVYEAGEETSKLIEVEVVWEDDGSTTISNIKPSAG